MPYKLIYECSEDDSPFTAVQRVEMVLEDGRTTTDMLLAYKQFLMACSYPISLSQEIVIEEQEPFMYSTGENTDQPLS